MNAPVISSEDFKQGSKRKVNDNNFYLICEYIEIKLEYRQTHSIATHTLTENSRKLIELIEKNDWISVLISTGPKRRNSKAFIDKSIEESNTQLARIKHSLKTGDYSGYGGYYKNDDDLNKAIEHYESAIKDAHKRYIELTDEMMFNLHMFISDFDEDLYKSMTSWIKQKRFREKNGTNQVTLSNSGKYALDALKVKLGEKDLNSTLCKLNELH